MYHLFYNAGIMLMFQPVNFFGQDQRRIAGGNFAFCLEYDVAIIIMFVDEVNGDAAERIP